MPGFGSDMPEGSAATFRGGGSERLGGSACGTSSRTALGAPDGCHQESPRTNRLVGGGGATGCQGNPCSTGIRWGVSPAAQMGCLCNRSGSPSGVDQP